MTGRTLTMLFLLSLAMNAASAAGLPESERTALFEAACRWSGASGADVAAQRCSAPSELTWSSLHTGNFVEGEGEWLVSLAGPCIGGCPGVSFVARKTAQGWRRLHEDADLVTDECAVVRLADGRDRVACLGAAGPNQGFMTQWLVLREYGGKGAVTQLLHKESGGECSLAATPDAEYDGDELSGLAAGRGGSDALLTVKLTVRRAPCTAGDDSPEAQASIRGTHVLRFVQRGGELVPEAPTAALIERLGWSPER